MALQAFSGFKETAMAAEVLGISGSPIPNSNTDRAVQCVLEATGLSTAFVKLSNLHMEPCRGCLGCKDTNRCVLKDDGAALAEQFRAAKAFVVGAYTPYNSLNAHTKMFMERMYCLRHQAGLNRGKIGAAVITTAVPPGAPGLPPAYETAAAQINLWMMTERMTNLGSIAVVGNPPCIRCGYGDPCAWSGVRRAGPGATVASLGVSRFEESETLQHSARDLGRRIGAAVLAAN
jgi:multimeric flavodoxin WrbA